MALYRMGMVREGFEKAGKKLEGGQGSIRFKKLDDLALQVLARAVALMPMKNYVEFAQQVHSK